jgi:hypothetical protein
VQRQKKKESVISPPPPLPAFAWSRPHAGGRAGERGAAGAVDANAAKKKKKNTREKFCDIAWGRASARSSDAALHEK